MPKIPENVAHSVFFLFRSKAQAERGRDARGTGFIVRYQEDGATYYYAVSNEHVPIGKSAPVIRINVATDDVADDDAQPPVGKAFETFSFCIDDWVPDSAGDDIAVVQLDSAKLPSNMFGIDTSHFVSQHEFQWGQNAYGIGDDAFMLGLFLDHVSDKRNRPVARFGSVSMTPHEEFPNFLVDMHTRGGFSGSPVFIFRTFGQTLEPLHTEHITFNPTDMMAQLDAETLSGMSVEVSRSRGAQVRYRPPKRRNVILDLYPGTRFSFLGMHKGQYYEKWTLLNDRVLTAEETALLSDDNDRRLTIRGPSGMSEVIPAWKILEVLDMPKLKGQRIAQRARRSPSGPETNA